MTSWLPSFHFSGNSYLECQSECSKLDECIAFDVHDNHQCNLRFASKDVLLDAPNPFNYTKWWKGGCENTCVSNYVGKGQNGHCWIKDRGKYRLPSFWEYNIISSNLLQLILLLSYITQFSWLTSTFLKYRVHEPKIQNANGNWDRAMAQKIFLIDSMDLLLEIDMLLITSILISAV